MLQGKEGDPVVRNNHCLALPVASSYCMHALGGGNELLASYRPF